MGPGCWTEALRAFLLWCRAEGRGLCWSSQGGRWGLRTPLSEGRGGGSRWLPTVHSRSEQAFGAGLGSMGWMMTSLFSCRD